jgi:hypothetical protein
LTLLWRLYAIFKVCLSITPHFPHTTELPLAAFILSKDLKYLGLALSPLITFTHPLLVLNCLLNEPDNLLFTAFLFWLLL